MNNNLRLEDYLRAYADIHEHTILNTQALEVRMHCRERKPFAVVIGRTCGVRIQDIDFKRYYKSMTSLRHSLEQHRTVLLFCLPKHTRRKTVCTDFERMTQEHFSRWYALLDPAAARIGISEGSPVRKPAEEPINLSPECRKHLRECVDYLQNKCMRTERQKPKKNRVNGHGFERTFAANELMSRY